MRRKRSVYRGFEAILATVGGLISFATNYLILFSGNFTEFTTLGFGAISLIGSIFGITSAWYSFRDAKIAGVALIISSILVLFDSSIYGTIGAILILMAGISDLFRD